MANLKLKSRSTAGKSTSSKSTTTTRKPAAKRGSTTKAAPNRRSQTAKAKGTTQTRQAPRSRIDERLLNKHVKLLQTAGTKLEKAQEAHKDAIDAVHELAQEAIDAGVPMSVVSRETGVSRQWLYKMGSSAGRDGSKPKKAGRPAAKKTSTRKPAAQAKASTTRKATPRGGVKLKSRR